jgi:hypothetical protein
MPGGKIRTIHGLTALKGGQLAVFGPARGPGSVALVYDGSAWSEVTLPPYVDEVRSYVRADDGTTWALVVRLGDKEEHLWSARPGREWTEVPVHGLGDHVLLRRLAILNGELWLLALAGNDAVLLRPRPLGAPVVLPL